MCKTNSGFNFLRLQYIILPKFMQITFSFVFLVIPFYANSRMQDDLWTKLFTTLLYNSSYMMILYDSCRWISDHEFPFHPTNTGTQTIEHTPKQKKCKDFIFYRRQSTYLQICASSSSCNKSTLASSDKSMWSQRMSLFQTWNQKIERFRLVFLCCVT